MLLIPKTTPTIDPSTKKKPARCFWQRAGVFKYDYLMTLKKDRMRITIPAMT